MDKLKFIQSIVPGAKDAMKKYHIFASVTIAQAILESSWGSRSPGNNLFGIKWTEGCGRDKQVFKTWEVEKGQRVEKDLPFRKYNSLADSILDHALLLTNKRYTPVRQAKTYMDACCQLQRCGYATDPDYAQKLTSIIKSNHLDQYDK